MRKIVADGIGIAIAQMAKRRIDFPSPTTFPDDALQLVFRRRANGESKAIAGQHVEAFDVVHGLSGHDRMGTAGVIANHSAQGAVGMS